VKKNIFSKKRCTQVYGVRGERMSGYLRFEKATTTVQEGGPAGCIKFQKTIAEGVEEGEKERKLNKKGRDLAYLRG